MKKTRLYLDVDGCLNAFNPYYLDGNWDDYQQGVAQADLGRQFYINWSPSMVQALLELDLEIVWTTTWQDAANTGIAPLLGLPEDSRVLAPLSGVVSFPSLYWKAEAVRADQERDPSPFIWAEDELADNWRDLSSPIDMAKGFGGLPLDINPDLGITKTHIEAMKAYIAERSS